MNDEDLEKELFIADCMLLKKILEIYCSRYSNRVKVSVFCNLIKHSCLTEKNPEAALQQIRDIFNEDL